MSNGILAYGLEMNSEKYFDQESIETINNEAGLHSAMRAHGLDYTVEMQQLKHPTTGKDIPFYATVRTDTNAVLGAGLTSRYNVIQNRDGFSLGANLAQETKDGLVLARGMTFDAGRVAVAQFDLGEMVIGDKGRGGFEDRVKRRLTWTNSHDGSGAMKVFTTPIRIVCANTLTAAIGMSKDGITISHTESSAAKVQQARKLLKVVNGHLARTEATYNALANTKVSQDMIKAVLADLFPSKGEEVQKATYDAIEAIKFFYESADGGRIEKETGWNLYNAITHYTDHKSPIRVHGVKSQEEARMQSTLTGAIAQKNAKALNTLVQVLDIDSDIERMLKKVETSQVAQLAAYAPQPLSIFDLEVGVA